MRTGKKRIHELKLYFGFLFDARMDAIKPYHIEKWRLSERAKGSKFSTIRRNETTLKAALNKAVEWGFIAVNPLTGLKPVKIEDNRIVAYLDTGQELRLLKAINDREERIKSGRESANDWRKTRNYDIKPGITGFADHLKPMVIVSLNTGLRRGELLSLKWSEVDFSNKVLTVTGDNAKSGNCRHVPLNKNAVETLELWRLQVDGAFVFPGINGGKLSDMPKKPWAAVLKEAGITVFRWHDMRHHFAGRLVMAGVDLNTVRELLGHSDLKMTLRYAHLAPEHKAAAVKVLES
jgi:integrase